VLALAAGILLAASAGLRVFMPLFGAGLAVRFLDWPVSEGVEWLASDAGLLALGAATAVELIADKVPVVDHVLDAVHTVAGPVAGALVAFGAFAEMPPALALVLALAVGAPVAGGVHALAASARMGSTVATGGAANPAVSAAEDGISVAAITIAVLLPVLAVLGALVVIGLVGWALARRRARAGAAPGGPPAGRPQNRQRAADEL
jgi:hypothetical protein